PPREPCRQSRLLFRSCWQVCTEFRLRSTTLRGVSPEFRTPCNPRLAIMTGNPYTQDMSTSNVTPIRDAAHELRRARGQLVKDMIDRDGRSARYVALNVGLNPTSMGE